MRTIKKNRKWRRWKTLLAAGGGVTVSVESAGRYGVGAGGVSGWVVVVVMILSW